MALVSERDSDDCPADGRSSPNRARWRAAVDVRMTLRAAEVGRCRIRAPVAGSGSQVDSPVSATPVGLPDTLSTWLSHVLRGGGGGGGGGRRGRRRRRACRGGVRGPALRGRRVPLANVLFLVEEEEAARVRRAPTRDHPAGRSGDRVSSSERCGDVEGRSGLPYALSASRKSASLLAAARFLRLTSANSVLRFYRLIFLSLALELFLRDPFPSLWCVFPWVRAPWSAPRRVSSAVVHRCPLPSPRRRQVFVALLAVQGLPAASEAPRGVAAVPPRGVRGLPLLARVQIAAQNRFWREV